MYASRPFTGTVFVVTRFGCPLIVKSIDFGASSPGFAYLRRPSFSACSTIAAT
jgi:hypothetical protein